MTPHNPHHIAQPKMIIGWNEWCSLPELGIPAIKAKIDTGAKTSAIHAFNIQPVTVRGKKYVWFELHPLQNNNQIIISCKAEVVDRRLIMSSNGHKEHRYVIATPLELGDKVWTIELTLSNRDPLQFRMLLGRAALTGRVVIDPSHGLVQKRIRQNSLNELYRYR